MAGRLLLYCALILTLAACGGERADAYSASELAEIIDPPPEMPADSRYTEYLPVEEPVVTMATLEDEWVYPQQRRWLAPLRRAGFVQGYRRKWDGSRSVAGADAWIFAGERGAADGLALTRRQWNQLAQGLARAEEPRSTMTIRSTRKLGADGLVVRTCCEAETVWYTWRRDNALFTAWQSCFERCTFATERAAVDYAEAIDKRARG